MVDTPYPDVEVPRGKGHARAVREGLRTRVRDLVDKVCRALKMAQANYKCNYDRRVRDHNKEIEVGEWRFGDCRAETTQKLGTKATGPYKVTARVDQNLHRGCSWASGTRK